MQEAQVQSLVQEDPTCHGATKPVNHNYRPCALISWASLIAQLVKNLPAMQETLVRFLDREDPLENG